MAFRIVNRWRMQAARATKAAIPASALATAHRSSVGRRAIARWAFAISLPTTHVVADSLTPDRPGLARSGRTGLRATGRALDGVDVTPHAPLRSRWTNAGSVSHAQRTAHGDSLPWPRKDTSL